MTIDEIALTNPDYIIWDGFDTAIIGICQRKDSGTIIYKNSEGEFKPTLSEDYSFDLEDGEEIEIDPWGRETFDVVLYDRDKIMGCLMRDFEMNEEEAIEYFYYNVDGGYIGEYTPIAIGLDQEENEEKL